MYISTFVKKKIDTIIFSSWWTLWSFYSFNFGFILKNIFVTSKIQLFYNQKSEALFVSAKAIFLRCTKSVCSNQQRRFSESKTHRVNGWKTAIFRSKSDHFPNGKRSCYGVKNARFTDRITTVFRSKSDRFLIVH